MPTGSEIRKSFLDYFVKQGHTVVKSSSLVPDKDPTLLFTNAGMVQFKNVFLGRERLPYVRAASSQKCLRISGKHNDLEAVGRDTYHHTFFEMLGNWSFGDYYKAEAIEWAWELLTREWGLPKDKLWATVYLDDDEAQRLWAKISGLPAERILRFGEQENFWEMGETGPCGPCSEIHLDRGPTACDMTGQAGHQCRVNGDCARYIELWNLVFIQYNRKENRELEELPSKHVDTGMGLERITAVLQGVLSNYDIDFMRDLIATAERLAGKRYARDPVADVSFRVIADHARAVSFLIADGVMPSNEGRGYVLRRLLRRAARHGRLIGLTEPFLYQVADTVVAVMGDAYPELRSEHERIRDIIRTEEARFADTLEKGLVLLEQATAELKQQNQRVLPGEVAFRLYDTYGFPLDLTEDILRGEGLTIDHAGFEMLMDEQRKRGREARGVIMPGTGSLSISGVAPIMIDVADRIDVSDVAAHNLQRAQPVKFIGYDHLEAESQVLALYSGGEGKPEVVEGMEVDVLTAETPFYGESGGQVGDRGIIETARGDRMEVIDTQHPTPQLTVHRGRVQRGRFQIDDKVHLVVDRNHRQRIMLNHSATHILHAVLREELGSHVRQAGSLVAPDRLRFDFNHTGHIAEEKLQTIEDIVNRRIRQDADVSIEETTYEEAMRKGALAFFGDKYGDRVRVVQIGDFSTELCGGTHVHRSGEIGIFKLHSETGVAAGVRRVEALTGHGALDLIRKYEQRLKEISELVRASADDAIDKVKKLLERQKELEKEIEQLRGEFQRDQIPELLARKQSIGGTDVLVTQVDGVEARQLREIADQLKQKLGSGVVVLASARENNVNLVASVSQDLTDRYHAGHIIKELAPIVGGGGGGRPDFAQAGGKEPAKLSIALKRAEELIRQIK
ncbi:MAG TPA: alanine--tRNA ligase [Candidatus Binatia bacterium]|nr:alanine--tRNA ligase [Candidatus Binatia bacterium]